MNLRTLIQQLQAIEAEHGGHVQVYDRDGDLLMPPVVEDVMVSPKGRRVVSSWPGEPSKRARPARVLTIY